MLLCLRSSPVLALQVPEQFGAHFSEARISELRGGALKHNEDALDAIVCLYIAGLYQAGYDRKVFGTASEGYIYVPRSLHRTDGCFIKKTTARHCVQCLCVPIHTEWGSTVSGLPAGQSARYLLTASQQRGSVR